MSRTNNTDSWGDPATTSSRVWTSNTSATVRDDWDDDDDEEAREEEDPQRLWEEANTRAPMPHVVIASSSTSAAAALSPPPAALQPVLRILKRPSASTSASASSIRSTPSSNSSSSRPSESSPPPPGGPQSYAEREAAYHAARERIFGEAASASSPSPGSGGIAPESLRARTPTSTSSGVASGPTVAVPITREPKGPPVGGPRQGGGKLSEESAQGGDGSRGFVNRRGKRRGGGRP